MKIAVIGCSHGELDIIYEDIRGIEERQKTCIDLVIICGDFQAVRNEYDLQCMAVPFKYRQLQTFHKYYSGQSVAPKLTLFIGGNHEASNYLQTLAYGGWVADNIYFMGYASVVRFKGLRIGGISGIHNNKHTNSGHYERLPYDEDTKRSAYHMRQSDVYKLMQLNGGSNDNESEIKQSLDVMISHDWPLNIHSCGDVDGLLRRKRHFLHDIRNNCLGNPLLEPLMRQLKPKQWFSAHLHVRFEAFINFTPDMSVQTRFLALDKVLPKRQYMEIIDIEPTEQSDSNDFEYDAEWLAILQSTNKLMSIDKRCSVPSLVMSRHSVSESDINKVKQLFDNDLKIPKNFKIQEPALNGSDNDSDPQRIRNYVNSQTVEFCKKLGITDPMSAIIESMKPLPNPDQISISDDEEDDEEEDKTDENPQKRHKADETIDGGDLFFVDRKGGDNPKGAQIDLKVNKLIENKNHNSNDIMTANTSADGLLTKRQQKRRADKVKKQTKQVETLNKIKTNNETKNQIKDNNITKNKKLKDLNEDKIVKKEIKAIIESNDKRRQLIIERLDWVKANLPMKDPEVEIEVITLDDLNIQ
ncbi:lariat debranching enzyme B-like [Oppia nitens]|uniref:lariat debranching enzyme B-like n=1 Tax=Oppia nitens TaxID=1686743 RepID=UPI0023DB6AC0|nr:lariat debranching enzyme B-like [Oppia nitens]